MVGSKGHSIGWRSEGPKSVAEFGEIEAKCQLIIFISRPMFSEKSRMFRQRKKGFPSWNDFYEFPVCFVEQHHFFMRRRCTLPGTLIKGFSVVRNAICIIRIQLNDVMFIDIFQEDYLWITFVCFYILLISSKISRIKNTVIFLFNRSYRVILWSWE